MLKTVSSYVNFIGALNYKGAWNASTNSPALASGVGTKGDYYVVSVAGNTNLDGETNWGVGDWAVFNGSVWQKVDGGSTGLLTTLTVTGNTYLATTSGNVGIGTTSPGAKFEVVGSGLTLARIKGGSGANQGSAYYIEQAGSTNTLFAIGDSAAILGGATDASVALYTPGSVPFISFVGGAERMRITAAGDVGIGTSSPSYKLDVSAAGAVTARVQNTSTSADASFQAQNTVATGLFGVNAIGQYMYTAQAVPLLFYNNNAERMRLDSAGNLGLGVTPSAWNSVFTNIDLNTTGSIGAYAGAGLYSVYNGYFNSGGNWIYKTTAAAAYYNVSAGTHSWYTAPSGTAGDAISFTQAMTLDASGNLGIGTSSPTVKLEVYDATTGELRVTNATQGFQIYTQASATTLGTYTNIPLILRTNAAEAMRITAAGDVGIGTTNPSGFGNTGKLAIQTASSTNGIVATFANSGATGAAIQLFQNGVDVATIGMPANSAGITFAPSGTTERMRLDSSGNLGVGTSSPGAKLTVAGAAEAIRMAQASPYLSFYNAAQSTRYGYIQHTGTNLALVNEQSGSLEMYTSNTERMRITSAGDVGIGTSSPASKLHVVGVGQFLSGASGTFNYVDFGRTGGDARVAVPASANDFLSGTAAGDALFYAPATGNAFYGTAGAKASIFVTNNTERMRLDSSGNLGLGVTPSAWTLRAIQGPNAEFVFAGLYPYVASNAYYATGWKYQTTAAAAHYVQALGSHQWFTAPSGTAGDAISFTQAMTLDASGNLGLGVTPSAWNSTWKASEIQRAGNAITSNALNSIGITSNAYVDSVGWKYGATGTANFLAVGNGGGSFAFYQAASGTAGDAISFTQAMTLDASGRLLVGGTSAPASGEVKVVLTGGASAGSSYMTFQNNSTNNGCTIGTSGQNFIVYTNTGATGFETYTERARITSDGSLGIGGTSFGSGALVMFIANATTAPTTDPTGGGILYVEGGALKYRGSSGTVTTIANA